MLNVDTSTLKVVSSKFYQVIHQQQTYTLASGLKSLDDTSKAYFLQETDTGKFEVYFGDGVLGKKLDDGNIVILEYIVSNKEESKRRSSFFYQVV